MKVKFISPIGHTTPLLFETFIPVFKEKGIEIVDKVEDADCFFMDYFSGAGRWDENMLNGVYETNKPIIIFDMTDFGAMSKERWFYHKHNTQTLSYIEHYLLRCIFNNRKIVYFMRKMDKTIVFPEWMYPFELIQYPDHIFPITTMEELLSRPYEICWVGNSSPTRKNVVNELSKHFKMYVHWTDENGKLPHDEWLTIHRQSKMFCSLDGGGYSDERSYQLITISPMLKNRNNHLQVHPFKDATQCVEVNENPTPLDISNLRLVLTSKKWLYDMYLNGIEHMNKYYTSEYRANYILNILNQNGIN